MPNPKLYVRATIFDGDRGHLFWSNGNFAWGALSSAAVFTEDEVKSYVKKDTSSGDGFVLHHITGIIMFVPKGEWWSLPDTVKHKTRDEWLEDIT